MNSIDELGYVKAQIADLVRQEEKLKRKIRKLGHGKHEGQMYTAVVFEQARTWLDMDAVRRKLSRQFLASHTRHASVDVIKVTARQRRAA